MMLTLTLDEQAKSIVETVGPRVLITLAQKMAGKPSACLSARSGITSRHLVLHNPGDGGFARCEDCRRVYEARTRLVRAHAGGNITVKFQKVVKILSTKTKQFIWWILFIDHMIDIR